jgi:hypothetical protein
VNAAHGCQIGTSRFRKRQNSCEFIRRQFDSGCVKANSEVASSVAERVATGFQRARFSASSRRMKTRTRDKPRRTELSETTPVTAAAPPPWDAGQFRLGQGCGGRAPASKRSRRRRPDSERSVGPPRRGRVHSQEGAAVKARGGIGCKPVSPRSGAPKARLAAKEETRQAAKALLASVNAPGATRSDPRSGVFRIQSEHLTITARVQ